MAALRPAPDEPHIDNDLLADSWETRWVGDLTTMGLTTNSDGDALNDRAEYIAGTGPTNPTPELLLRAELKGSQVEVSFIARGTDSTGYQNAARHYRLESATSPVTAAAWLPISGWADRIAAPGATTLTYAVAPESNGARFYRLCVWLQQTGQAPGLLSGAIALAQGREAAGQNANRKEPEIHQGGRLLHLLPQH